MGRTGRTIAIVALTLAGCTHQIVPAETPDSREPVLRTYVTTATLPLIGQLSTAYSQVNPAVSFEVITGNFESVYQRSQADPSSYFLTNHLPASDLWAAPIGQDGIAVILNPQNPVANLSIEQLRDIYRGRVTDWRDLGGDDGEVVVFTREDGSGTRAEFERLLIGAGETTLAARIAPSSAAMVDAVGRTSGGIGYVSMSYLDARVKAAAIDGVMPTLSTVYENTYPLRSFLYFAGTGEPEGDYRAFIYWVQSRSGQQILERGYAPLTAP